MDPSALIFVALAVAWAVYLIPKALEHHEESARTRTVDRFSKTMRVLGRREPINRRKARLVPATGAPSSDANVLSDHRKSSTATTLDEKPTATQLRARRLTGEPQPAELDFSVLSATLAAQQAASPAARAQAHFDRASAPAPGADPLIETLLAGPQWQVAASALQGCFNRAEVKRRRKAV